MANFFVSIDKTILFNLIKKRVHEEWLLYLIEQIIFHDPTKNVYVKSSRKKMNLIPSYKSLFNANKNHGLPIGNLTSQFFSNVYLDVIDQYIKRNLRCKYYLRYVDDFVVLAENTKILNQYFKNVRDYAKNSIDVKLHPQKKLINKIDNGIDFVGYLIKPGRIKLRNRTRKKVFCVVNKWQKLYNKFAKTELYKFMRTINSYLCMAIHLNEYDLRFLLYEKINSLFINMDFCFSKVQLCNC